MGSRSSCGMMNQIQKMTMTSGTPRKNSTYIVAGMRIHGACASRARPTKMPSTKPSTMAGMASRSVPPTKGPKPTRPWSIKNLKLFTMTEKSMGRLGRRPHARDQAGNRVAPLDAGHDRGDGHAQHEIDQRAGRERLDGLRRVGLDLPRLERQLGHADRQRHRGVLQEVQRLARRRRHDEAQRDGHDDEPVGLERGEAN